MSEEGDGRWILVERDSATGEWFVQLMDGDLFNDEHYIATLGPYVCADIVTGLSTFMKGWSVHVELNGYDRIDSLEELIREMLAQEREAKEAKHGRQVAE